MHKVSVHHTSLLTTLPHYSSIPYSIRLPIAYVMLNITLRWSHNIYFEAKQN